MASAAERKAAQRARRAAQGLAKLELWMPKPLHQKVKAYAIRLMRSDPVSQDNRSEHAALELE